MNSRTTTGLRGLMLPAMAALLLAAAADARVKYVRVDDDGLTIPTIEVFQEQTGGESRYATLRSGGFPDDTVNLRVKMEGQCKFGYLLSGAWVDTTLYIPSNTSSGVLEVPPASGESGEPGYVEPDIRESVNYTEGNRTLGARIVDFRVPLENFAPLLDYGNEQVAKGNASPFFDWTAQLGQPVSAILRCKRALGYTGLDKWYAVDAIEKPVQVIYRGASAIMDLAVPPPGSGVYFDPSLPNGQLADQVQVEANLIIVDDPDANDCRLNLSGTFTTNGETVIFYRLVDDRGVTSPVYKVAVDQTYTAFVFHPVDLSEREPEGPFPGTDRGFSAIPTDRLQGFYQIEVVSPYETTSNIASYNIEPCSGRPEVIGSILAN